MNKLNLIALLTLLSCGCASKPSVNSVVYSESENDWQQELTRLAQLGASGYGELQKIAMGIPDAQGKRPCESARLRAVEKLHAMWLYCVADHSLKRTKSGDLTLCDPDLASVHKLAISKIAANCKRDNIIYGMAREFASGEYFLEFKLNPTEPRKAYSKKRVFNDVLSLWATQDIRLIDSAVKCHLKDPDQSMDLKSSNQQDISSFKQFLPVCQTLINGVVPKDFDNFNFLIGINWANPNAEFSNVCMHFISSVETKQSAEWMMQLIDRDEYEDIDKVVALYCKTINSDFPQFVANRISGLECDDILRYIDAKKTVLTAAIIQDACVQTLLRNACCNTKDFSLALKGLLTICDDNIKDRIAFEIWNANRFDLGKQLKLLKFMSNQNRNDAVISKTSHIVKMPNFCDWYAENKSVLDKSSREKLLISCIHLIDPAKESKRFGTLLKLGLDDISSATIAESVARADWTFKSLADVILIVDSKHLSPILKTATPKINESDGFEIVVNKLNGDARKEYLSQFLERQIKAANGFVKIKYLSLASKNDRSKYANLCTELIDTATTIDQCVSLAAVLGCTPPILTKTRSIIEKTLTADGSIHFEREDHPSAERLLAEQQITSIINDVQTVINEQKEKTRLAEVAKRKAEAEKIQKEEAKMMFLGFKIGSPLPKDKSTTEIKRIVSGQDQSGTLLINTEWPVLKSVGRLPGDFLGFNSYAELQYTPKSKRLFYISIRRHVDGNLNPLSVNPETIKTFNEAIALLKEKYNDEFRISNQKSEGMLYDRYGRYARLEKNGLIIEVDLMQKEDEKDSILEIRVHHKELEALIPTEAPEYEKERDASNINSAKKIL